MDGLDLLGAADALANQFIVLRVKNIDREKLKAKLGSKGALAGAGLMFVDAAPKAALDAVAPFIPKAAKDYGIDLEVGIFDRPPPTGGRGFSEFWPGLLMGGVVGGSSLLIVKLIARMFRR